MRIYQEMENTERFLDYLLMTGFGEEKVRTLLDKGEVFVLNDNGVIKTVCVVEPLKNGNCQMRAIVTLPDDRKKGYGKNMLQYVCEHYSEEYHTMFVGVLVSADNIDFYRKCGFEKSWTATEMQYFKRTLDSIIDIKKVVDMALEAGRILLKNGADPNFRWSERTEASTISHSILCDAIINTHEVAFVGLLLRYKADPTKGNTTQYVGYPVMTESALHCAVVYAKSKAILDLLFSNGLNLNTPTTHNGKNLEFRFYPYDKECDLPQDLKRYMWDQGWRGSKLFGWV